MNTKLLALAAAAVFSAPLASPAAENAISIYGTLNVSADSVKAEGAASPGDNIKSRNRVTSNSSAFGLRGSESLGGGLSAIFQIESGVAMDAGTSGTSTGTLATRNSRLGLRGDLGTIFFGNWDTPYKSATATGRIDAFYAAGMPYYADVISGNSTPTAANAANRNAFDRRQNNSVQYWTPGWNGLSGRFAYSANEQRTSESAAIAQNPNLYSAAAIYVRDPLYLSLAYEKHDEFANTAAAKSSDQGIKLGAAYTFRGATTVGVIYEQLKFGGNVGATGLKKIVPDSYLTSAQLSGAAEARIDSYYLSLRHAFGRHAIRAMYGSDMGLKVDGALVPSTTAKTYAIGYSYSLSKRTDLYAYYVTIRNDVNSSNDFATGGIGGVGAGADPTGFSFHIRHTF